MKLLVTGASGFIGSYLCKKLVDDGHEVQGLSRWAKSDSARLTMAHKNFTLLKCDIANFNQVREVFTNQRYDVIFHMAAFLPGQPTEDPLSFVETNVKGTLNLLQAAQLENHTRVIYSSSMTVYGAAKYLPVDEKHPTEPVSLYGLTKLIGERICQFYAEQYGFKVLILRYAGVFGPGKKEGAIYNFVTRVLQNESPVIYSDGRDVWDTLHVNDVVTANCLALENIDRHGLEIVNIGAGRGINVTEVARKVVDLTGAQVDIKFGTAPGLPDFYYDISKAQALLGFKPTSFDTSLTEYIRWERSRKLNSGGG